MINLLKGMMYAESKIKFEESKKRLEAHHISEKFPNFLVHLKNPISTEQKVGHCTTG